MPRITATDGVALHYEVAGEGLPVLALAGLTRNARDFDHVAPYLDGVQLIRMDYRGRGLSDWAPSETYTIPQEAADALALLDHLGLERAAILGTSRGGLIGMGLAAQVPGRLLGLLLNDIGPVIDARGMDRIRGYIGVQPGFASHAEAAEARARTWTEFTGVPMARWLAEVRAQYEETPDGLRLRYDPALRDTVAGKDDAPLPDLWPLFDAAAALPLAVVRGAASDLLSRETLDEMARRAPDMIRAEVPGRGHVPFLDEPEALRVLGAWLEKMR